MDAAAELGRNPVSNHQIQPEYGDEQVGMCRYSTALFGSAVKQNHQPACMPRQLLNNASQLGAGPGISNQLTLLLCCLLARIA